MDNGFYCKHMIGLFGVRLVVLFEEAASILINLFFAFCIIVTVNINVLCVCVCDSNVSTYWSIVLISH